MMQTISGVLVVGNNGHESEKTSYLQLGVCDWAAGEGEKVKWIRVDVRSGG